MEEEEERKKDLYPAGWKEEEEEEAKLEAWENATTKWDSTKIASIFMFPTKN